MPIPAPRRTKVHDHPGSSAQEVADEPDWGAGHQHRIGFRNRQERVAGFTHDSDLPDPDEQEEDEKFTEDAMRQYQDLRQRAKKGDLVNFQELMKNQTDFHRHRPNVYPPGFRFVVRGTEDWVKKEQDWPANIKARKKQEQQEKEQDEKEKKEIGGQVTDKEEEKQHAKEEHEENNYEDEWRKQNNKGGKKHHGAYGKSKEKQKGDEEGAQQSRDQQSGDQQNGENQQKTEYQKLRQRYSPEEITLLRHLQHESEHLQKMQLNDGKRVSPVKSKVAHRDISIEIQDAMTPDNWVPRSGDLVRRTGQHPFNAEPRLEVLFQAGLITPNALHYVRNHGSVPRLYWDTHMLDVCDGALKLSMDDLQNLFQPVNIPVAMGCDGNRRGELNLLKKSKGFNWGPCAISCAYWKGALLWQVLEKAGVKCDAWNGRRQWVNFQGADELSEGKYETSIPLDYALDRANDVLLAYEMNDTKLPADHGFPVRLLIPGFVGGRSVKWLARIWISDEENQSYYHIWDNRVLPAFITEKDGAFATTMFHHPSTKCMEQNLNSVIVHPGQGEKLNILDFLKKDTYRIEGYAYDGGGHEVQRVEISLDHGKSWLYSIRTFPDSPIRNGNKFWTWLHWHVDVEPAYLIRAESVVVRCFNVFKNTQPEEPVWNVMGMMNNGWYTVKPETTKDGELMFRHPFHQEDNEGWMKPSVENQLAAAQQGSNTPDKQFTRQEIEKHSSKDDCWLVINNNVYDATSVLSWHPGGSAPLLANAGKLSLDVTSSFESIHDDYAHKKLQEHVIGKVTDKAVKFMQEQAKEEAERASKEGESKTFLQAKKWVPVKLVNKEQISQDTFTYTFSYAEEDSREFAAEYDQKEDHMSGSADTDDEKKDDTQNGGKANKNKNRNAKQGKHYKPLGLHTCQHIQFGIHMLDKLLIRSYTPTRPIAENEEDGTFDLTVKTYFPDENQPGGAFSNFLYELDIGEQVEVCGPTGEITYVGMGKFNIEGREKTFNKISLVLGGSGVTPGYSLIKRVSEELASDDNKEAPAVRIIDANKTEDDILLHDDLNKMNETSKGKIQTTFVLSHPGDKDKWEKNGGLRGHVNEDMIKHKLFEPGDRSVVFLCGPPAMIQKAALPALKDWGYEEDENCFGF